MLFHFVTEAYQFAFTIAEKAERKPKIEKSAAAEKYLHADNRGRRSEAIAFHYSCFFNACEEVIHYAASLRLFFNV